MTELMITECPGCHARFRVSEGQLKLAAGKVRCGACLQVFDAEAQAQRLAIHLKQLEAAAKRQQSPKTKPSAEPSPRQAAAPHTAPQQHPAETTRTSTEPAPAPAPVDADNDQAVSAQQEPATTPAQAAAPEAPPRAKKREAELPPLLEMRAEPLILEMAEERDTAYATAGWLLAIVLAAGLLLFQWLWFERASLARDPNLHPFYTLLCDSVNCDLSRNAVAEIVNQQLVVRPHPKFGDALSVSLRLLNRSPFAQPFPNLELSFHDLKGRPVAERRFTPNDYLNTQRFDPTHMPPETPIELRLDILDPGRRAVSYELKIEPAD